MRKLAVGLGLTAGSLIGGAIGHNIGTVGDALRCDETVETCATPTQRYDEAFQGAVEGMIAASLILVVVSVATNEHVGRAGTSRQQPG